MCSACSSLLFSACICVCVLSNLLVLFFSYEDGRTKISLTLIACSSLPILLMLIYAVIIMLCECMWAQKISGSALSSQCWTNINSIHSICLIFNRYKLNPTDCVCVFHSHREAKKERTLISFSHPPPLPSRPLIRMFSLP